VGGLDCWIAATATLGDFDLVTQDRALAERLHDVPWSESPWRAPTVVHVDLA
jgi:predicted nucleic acid-binding protein